MVHGCWCLWYIPPFMSVQPWSRLLTLALHRTHLPLLMASVEGYTCVLPILCFFSSFPISQSLWVLVIFLQPSGEYIYCAPWMCGLVSAEVEFVFYIHFWILFLQHKVILFILHIMLSSQFVSYIQRTPDTSPHLLILKVTPSFIDCIDCLM